MKKAYIQPEFDLLKLSSSEDILVSVTTVEGNWGNEGSEVDDGLVEDGIGGGESWE